jgi:hypothetical protein
VLGDGQGDAELIAAADVVALGETPAVGEALGVGEGVGDAFALLDGEAVGDGVVAGAQAVAEGGARSVWLPGAAVAGPPRSSKAAGTTSKPMMTAITKASAPHSWSQKAREELRIRARRRQAQAGACFWY